MREIWNFSMKYIQKWDERRKISIFFELFYPFFLPRRRSKYTQLSIPRVLFLNKYTKEAHTNYYVKERKVCDFLRSNTDNNWMYEKNSTRIECFLSNLFQCIATCCAQQSKHVLFLIILIKKWIYCFICILMLCCEYSRVLFLSKSHYDSSVVLLDNIERNGSDVFFPFQALISSFWILFGFCGNWDGASTHKWDENFK